MSDRALGRVAPFVLLAITSLLFAACEREAGPPGPPGPAAGEPTTPADEEAPVRAVYLCGNRFLLINAQPFGVRVTWRVQGSDEQGEQALEAAPAEDPSISEVELSVQHEGRLALYRGDQLLAVRDNERRACAPASASPSFAAAGTTYSQSGQKVTATNVSYNGSLGTNGSTSIGFNGSYTAAATRGTRRRSP